jgi:hypothetical protein
MPVSAGPGMRFEGWPAAQSPPPVLRWKNTYVCA